MLRLLTIASAVGLFALSGCDDTDLFSYTFSVDQQYGPETVSTPAAGSAQVTVPMPDVQDDLDYTTQVFDVIDEVNISRLALRIDDTAPSAPTDWSFLDEITIYISLPGGTPEQLAYIARTGSNDQLFADTTLELTPSNIDLLPYIEANGYEITVDATTNSAVSVDFFTEITFKFKVSAF